MLVLAGTTEATLVAGSLDRGGYQVISSLAGVTSTPVARPGAVRTGGFGGAEGLADYLRAERIDAVVDATHPFAAVMPFHAAEACDSAGVAHCRLLRPPWRAGPEDHWVDVPDLAAAAAVLAELPPRRVFLAIGRQGLAAFSPVTQHQYLVRSIEPPDVSLVRATSILSRGPFGLDDELALLREHAIDILVTKNAGGEVTAPKLAAARAAGVEVVMVDRPPGPPGVTTVETEAAAMEWVRKVPSRGDEAYTPRPPRSDPR